jgi:bifunctional non-homologous end joining protein LigD
MGIPASGDCQSDIMARKHNLPPPDWIAPQLATPARKAPASGDWSYEIKFDGYRLMTRIDGGDIRLLTRRRNNWTVRLPALCDAVAALPVSNAWLDGEIVVLDSNGVPDFNALQNAFDHPAQITYFVFDLLWINGEDIRGLPLRARREVLRQMIGEGADNLRFSEDFAADPASLLESARNMGLEGIIGKRADRPFRSGRSTDWIKIKCMQRQDFPIVGYTTGRGGLQSLILAVERDGVLRFAGTVEPTGLRSSQLRALTNKLASLERDSSVLSNPPSDRYIRWSEPKLLADVSFVEWTPGGHVRHPEFRGVRDPA